MENRKDFFDWYKTRITDNAQDPPPHVWQNIEDELDTNDVWDRVAAKLDDDGGWFSQESLYYAIPALLLLLLSTTLYFHQKGGSNFSASTRIAIHAESDSTTDGRVMALKDSDATSASQTGDEASEFEKQSSDELKDSRVDKRDQITSDAGDAFSSLEKQIEKSTKETYTESVVTSNEEKSPREIIANGNERESLLNTRTTQEGNNIAPDTAGSEHYMRKRPGQSSGEYAYINVDIQRITMPDSMLTIPVLVAIGEHSIKVPEAILPLDRPLFTRTLEFGISASIKNTWLLNQMTFMGLEKHTLTTTLPDFGKDIGLVFRYNFSRMFSVQTEGFLVSEMGQRYNEYRKGKYIERDVDLDYYHVNLLIKYGRNDLIPGGRVHHHGITGGLFYSKLKNATEIINDVPTSIFTYSRYDYGVLIGYEYNQNIFSNLMFTSGVRLSYGLTNIRTHAGSKTATGSFDVNVALKYKIGL